MPKLGKILSLCVLAVLFLFAFSYPASATQFGEWELRKPNTEYFAESAGIVVCNTNSLPDQDSSAIATTPGNIIRVETRFNYNGDHQYPALSSLTFPVRQGDTWRVVGEGARYCFWVPFID
ncbi:hypothetical protein [Moorena sp. SIO2C4]|uniref:hypothetical protein n=1 Tax=Moorena sp. SIO2C4 TaxID=2607824 RepID=UPI0013C67C7F|nr:hypothetical protein [Moorena sp. SIO2C4]NES44641.1 hypothetical protein [Moorena sp. SIO2C4]